MSYPGPLSTNVNLGCDTGNQRATDVFNFQLNTGAAGESSSLQSPAAIIPAVDGSTNLSLTSTGASADASIAVTAANPNGDAYIGLNGGANGTAFLNLAGGTTTMQIFKAGNTQAFNITAYPQQVGQSSLLTYNPNTGVSVFGDTKAGATTTINGTAIDVGTAATTAINLNATTSVSDAAGGSNLLVLSPVSASTSQIVQTPTGAGTLNIGSSPNNTDVLAVRDTGSANTGSVLIGGNGGNSIIITGSTNNAAATITTDRAPGNLGALTLGGSVGAPGISLTDSGVSFLQDTQTAINTTLTIGGNINMGTDGTIRNYSNSQTTGNAALGSGQTATITSTNPPPNGEGLYCVTIYAPNDITANVSGVAYWTGSLWYGGSTGNAAYRVQVGPSFNLLQFFNTSGTTMNGVYQTNVFQILGRTTA